MESRYEQLLVNYLDRTLEEREMREIEELINTDIEVRSQWQFMQLAVEAVEYVALNDQVAAVKEQFRTIHPVEVINEPRRGVRVMMRNIYKVAACLLFLVVATVAYKFISTSAIHVYKQSFIPYTLGTSRGSSAINEIEQAYRNKNWNQVLTEFDKVTEKDNKTLFLAGMANMQLQQYAAAGKLFEQVLTHNAKTGDDYFQDEAQYYLAMSYLANGQAKEAITLLQQIRTNKDHLYNRQASQISSTDLRILAFKSGK
jgi:tetratricopeptide (TPR) repeat protein